MVNLRSLAWVVLLGVVCGAAGAEDLSASDQRLLERLVLAEAGGESDVGMALVARSVLNRTALLQSRQLNPGTYNARGRGVSSVINARMQYEPVSSGTINRRRSSAQLARARRAITLARDTPALRRALASQRVRGAEANRLINATGFRTRSAYRDRSQSYDRQQFGNHVFNADRFSRRLNVSRTFEGRFGSAGSAGTQTNAAASSAQSPVSTVQRQLNARGAQLTPDGIVGPRTRAALKAFQRSQGLRPTGKLDRATQRALSAPARPATSLANQLRQIMPRLDARAADLYAAGLEAVLRKAQITTPAQKAAFLATVAYESCEMLAFEEVASGQCAVDSPLRSTFAQQNYVRLAREIGLDLLRVRSVAASPSIGFKVAAAHWKKVDANPVAATGDFRAVTTLAHWGREDYAQRLQYFIRARQALGVR